VCATEEARKKEKEREREKKRDERGTRGKGASDSRERIEPEYARQSLFLARRHHLNGSLQSVTYTTMHGKNQRVLISLVYLLGPQSVALYCPPVSPKVLQCIFPQSVANLPHPRRGKHNK